MSIVDPKGEAQPLYNTDRTILVTVNGEIYNHKQLRAAHCAHQSFRTESDCECIAHLYETMGPSLVKLLDGDFAFALADRKKGTFMAARDPIGVNSLYYGFGANGTMWFASELKALKDHCPRFYTFPPGHYYTPEEGMVRYFTPKWMEPGYVPPAAPADLKLIRETFVEAVRKRMMSDVPVRGVSDPLCLAHCPSPVR